MKIINFITALSITCCAAAIPASAEASKYEQISGEISQLKNSGLATVLERMAINALERSIKKHIQNKERQIRRLLGDIEYVQEMIQDFDSGNTPDWFDNDYNYKDEYLARIVKSQEKIVECQEDIEMFNDLLSEVQAIKG